MLIDEVEIVLEDQKPLLPFFDSVVGLAVLRQPYVVDFSNLAVGPLVQGGNGKDEEGEEGEESSGEGHGEGCLKNRED